MADEVLTIQQGTTRTIRVTGVKDAAGVSLNLAGWTVVAQARPDAESSTVYAEWSTTPTGTQLQATITGAGNDEIALAIPYVTSSTWAGWRAKGVATVAIEITEPGPNGRRESFERRFFLRPETVR